MLLYDPRKLTSPWDQTTCSRQQPIKDLHWQHTLIAKSSKTAVKPDVRARQSVNASADSSAMPSSVAAAPEQAAAALATPAATPHVSHAPCEFRSCQEYPLLYSLCKQHFAILLESAYAQNMSAAPEQATAVLATPAATPHVSHAIHQYVA